jgi:hypothetical protein
MTVADLDNYFPKEVERLFQLRDQTRQAVQHRDICREEVATLESDQRLNFQGPASHRATLVRQTGQALQQARLRLASAEAEARRLEDELRLAGRDIVFGRMTP